MRSLPNSQQVDGQAGLRDIKNIAELKRVRNGVLDTVRCPNSAAGRVDPVKRPTAKSRTCGSAAARLDTLRVQRKCLCRSFRKAIGTQGMPSATTMSPHQKPSNNAQIPPTTQTRELNAHQRKPGPRWSSIRLATGNDHNDHPHRGLLRLDRGFSAATWTSRTHDGASAAPSRRVAVAAGSRSRPTCSRPYSRRCRRVRTAPLTGPCFQG
jgi:hypothetical protein